MTEIVVDKILALNLLNHTMGYADGEMEWSEEDLGNVRLWKLSPKLWLLIYLTDDTVWYRIFEGRDTGIPLPIENHLASWNQDAGDFIWDNLYVEGSQPHKFDS